MIGVLSYGAYIPFHRISREEFSRAWGGASPCPERRL